MKKLYLFLLTLVLVVFTMISGMSCYGQSPVISSISPSSGGLGVQVSINGSNFSATAASNVVYFGAVAGTVTSASATQLTVTVPAGASYGPITVYNNSLTVPLVGTSARAFTPTFTSRNSIISSDFDSRTDITINSGAGASTKQIGIADLNGDSYKLAVSMSLGLRDYMANYSSVNATDPEFATNISETKPNVGFGVMLYNDVYFVGVSVPQIDIRTLGNASLQESNFRNTYYLTAGYSSGIGNDLKFRNVGLVVYSNQVPLVFNLSSTMVVKEIFDIGVNYRCTNEIAGIISANFNSYHVGYNYEFGATSSNIGSYSNATHEVTLGYRFGK